jgi:putative Holliday junction resolvase
VARANTLARIASPLVTIEQAADRADTLEQLARLVRKEGATQLVIGLPRGLNGQRTQQTAVVEEFGESVAQKLQLPITWQDEAVTSQKAEAELQSRGKPYAKGDIDALSAVYILEDYLRDNPEDS